MRNLKDSKDIEDRDSGGDLAQFSKSAIQKAQTVNSSLNSCDGAVSIIIGSDQGNKEHNQENS